jgi:hypothetical protein
MFLIYMDMRNYGCFFQDDMSTCFEYIKPEDDDDDDEADDDEEEKNMFLTIYYTGNR